MSISAVTDYYKFYASALENVVLKVCVVPFYFYIFIISFTSGCGSRLDIIPEQFSRPR